MTPPHPLPASHPASTLRRRVRRFTDSQNLLPDDDLVAVEEPLEIRIDTRSIAVLMRTPGHDQELAAGFLLSEGIVDSPSDLRTIRTHPRNPDGNVVDVFLADGRTLDFTRFTRHVFASSSCGLCGRTSIQAVHRHFPPLRDRFHITAATLLGLPGHLRAAQSGFAATGGFHAAALFSTDGTLVLLREDVGRHNAVDKVLGRLWLDHRLPARRSVLLVSGRASFEIIQKALAARVACVAAIGAPSHLAIQLARSSGQTLVGFLRDGRFNLYAGPARIRP